MVRIVFLLIVIFSLMNCSKPKIEKEHFIGKWKSDDGAVITLNENGTCTLQNINHYIFSSFPENNNKKLNTNGTWNMVNSESGIIDGINEGVKIIYEIPENQTTGSITFFISGQGIHGNNPPWSLYVWDGDPDEMKKYEFVK
ncbi:hypothetical protein [Chryseobacterium daecheongense]|nr:hypothetical protein [Chryseobacterium daecheongense]ROH99387.1 hypothetical protein EGI05_00380 [Chryseobacterium daecheongense]